VVARDRWHGATHQTRLGHDARPPAITFRPPNGHSSDLCAGRSRSSRPSSGSRGGPWPGPQPGRPTVLTRSLRPTGCRFRVWSRNDTMRPAVCHRS